MLPPAPLLQSAAGCAQTASPTTGGARRAVEGHRSTRRDRPAEVTMFHHASRSRAKSAMARCDGRASMQQAADHGGQTDVLRTLGETQRSPGSEKHVRDRGTPRLNCRDDPSPKDPEPTGSPLPDSERAGGIPPGPSAAGEWRANHTGVEWRVPGRMDQLPGRSQQFPGE